MTKTFELQQKQILIQRQKPEKAIAEKLVVKNKNIIAEASSPSITSEKSNGELADLLTKNLTKTIDTLLRPEHASVQMP